MSVDAHEKNLNRKAAKAAEGREGSWRHFSDDLPVSYTQAHQDLQKGSGQNARATVARAFCPPPFFPFMMACKCQSIREAFGRFIFTNGMRGSIASSSKSFAPLSGLCGFAVKISIQDASALASMPSLRTRPNYLRKLKS